MCEEKCLIEFSLRKNYILESKCAIAPIPFLYHPDRENCVFKLYLLERCLSLCIDYRQNFSNLFIKSIIVVRSSFVAVTFTLLPQFRFYYSSSLLFIDDNVTVDVFVIVYYPRSLCTRSFVAPAEMLSASHF